MKVKMRWTQLLLLTLGTFLLGTPMIEAEMVLLSIQDQISVGSSDRGVKVPIHATDMTGLDLISAEITVRYDPNVVTATGIDLAGTLAEGASSAYNVKGNHIAIALTRSAAFSGEGTLLFVVFDAVTQESEAASDLAITKAKLNEGRNHALELGYHEIQTAPVGVGAVAFQEMRLQMEFSANSNAEEVCVTFLDKQPLGAQPTGVVRVLNKYWVISRLGNGSFNVALTFTLGPGMLGPEDVAHPSNLKLFRRDEKSTGSWTLVASATSADAATGQVRFEGITSFSQFTIGTTGDSSLPVTLSHFSGKASDQGVLLRWTTQSEVNNLGFLLYRGESAEGPYERIGFVEGAGHSAFPLDYEFTDEAVTPGTTYYYYLEDVDISGQRTPSPVVQVSVPLFPMQFALLPSYPNPFNPEVWIPYRLAASAHVFIDIYDASGTRVRRLDLGVQPRGHYITRSRSAYWDGRNERGELVPSGVYYYTLRAGDFTATRKMVMLK